MSLSAQTLPLVMTRFAGILLASVEAAVLNWVSRLAVARPTAVRIPAASRPGAFARAATANTPSLANVAFVKWLGRIVVTRARSVVVPLVSPPAYVLVPIDVGNVTPAAAVTACVLIVWRSAWTIPPEVIARAAKFAGKLCVSVYPVLSLLVATVIPVAAVMFVVEATAPGNVAARNPVGCV